MLALAARAGPWVLVLGLVVGIAVPPLGHALFDYLRYMVMAALFLSILRMDLNAMRNALGALPGALATVLVFQLVLPLSILGVAAMFGWSGPVLTALVIMTAAPSIMGSPNMSIMLGRPPDTALRLLIIGTGILPLTVIPVFWAAPFLGGAETIAPIALKLLGTIALACGMALALRLTVLKTLTAKQNTQVEGLSAIVLAVFVVALMPQLGELLRVQPQGALFWLFAVLIANLGLQFLTLAVLKPRVSMNTAAPMALIAGNRNMALFLVALPPEITAPILIWIGCYQIPMYLTPLIMARFYRLT